MIRVRQIFVDIEHDTKEYNKKSKKTNQIIIGGKLCLMKKH